VRGDGKLLRSQILAAANELMTGAGSAGVSIRGIAERLGVTAPSIYLHFHDKQHLMQVVAASAFAEFDQSMRDTTHRVATPSNRLLAYGSAYVAFALKRPGHYRLALMSAPAAGLDSVDPAAARTVLEGLQPIVDDYLASRSLPGSDSLALTLGLWATAHGIASLLIATPQLPWGDLSAFVKRTLCAALQGFHAAG
jgi:AcrR family transcriptional regulator